MSNLPEVSKAALAAGVGVRFVYWSGHSGRRYVFTCTGGTAGDFESGVAIAVKGSEIVWAGEARDYARLPAKAPARRAAVFVHFLAATLAERRALIEDLRPVEHSNVLRLAA